MAASGAITQTENDIQGRMVKQVQYPADGGSGVFTTSYDYSIDGGSDWSGTEFAPFDSEGFSKVVVTDPDGHDTTFVSNFAGQRLALKDPNAGLSTYEYDLNGKTTQVISQTGLMQMTYDALGNMTGRDTWATYTGGAAADVAVAPRVLWRLSNQ